MPHGKTGHLYALGLFLVACFAVAAAGGLLTATSVDGWYETLVKPPFNPPAWIFPPVWNALFLLMAIAGWRVWTRTPAGPDRQLAITLFAVQLVANVLWSALFFGLRDPGLALVEVLVLEALIVAATIAFWRLDRVAGVLLIPYALWVAFAIALNGSIWWLN